MCIMWSLVGGATSRLSYLAPPPWRWALGVTLPGLLLRSHTTAMQAPQVHAAKWSLPRSIQVYLSTKKLLSRRLGHDRASRLFGWTNAHVWAWRVEWWLGGGGGAAEAPLPSGITWENKDLCTWLYSSKWFAYNYLCTATVQFIKCLVWQLLPLFSYDVG
jgi:hypothetical protein